MKITAIKAQVKNPDRVSIYVDEKYAFSLNHTQLLEQKLHSGLEIDESRLKELKQTSDFGKAFDRAINYVMIRPRSQREVRDYARRKKWTPDDTEAIIKKLAKFGYIDDANFARAWVESRALGNKTSRRKLILELKQKGVADDIIAAALAKTGFDELEALKAAVIKKRKLPRYANDHQKLMQYLVRQGFGFDDVKAVLSEN